MKKETKLLIALLLVFVGVGLTYAVYTTSVGGNANVSAANWLIKVKTGSNLNGEGIDVSGGANNIELGSCQKLAPGGSCTLPFRVDATGTEVDTILTVELGSNVSGATLEELTNAGINLRISDGINEDYAYLLNMGAYKDLNLVINWEAGDEDDDVKAAADVYIANNISEITIPVNMIVKQRLGGTRTVTFNTHDNNIQTPESIQVNDGETISNIPTLSKNGYIFVGWFTSENGGVQLTSSTPIIDNIEYHARFREPQNLTVSFNTHGGSNVNSVNVLEGGTLSELPSSPTKLGYTFAGWYTAETGGEAVTTSTVINNTIEFHAQWTIKYVSVTFDTDGGSSVTSPVQVQEGGTVSSIPTSTKSGFELIGWYDTNSNQLTASTQIMNDITYTARWGGVVSYNYSSVETIRSYTAPESGYYRLEAWGAQGATNNSYKGGYGGYSTADIYLNAGESVYLSVGGAGTGGNYSSKQGGLNGGGSATGNSDTNIMRGSGGGATHFASTSGLLSDVMSNDSSSVYLVAGGGGATAGNVRVTFVLGGHAGGFKGVDGGEYNEAAANLYNIVGVGGSSTNNLYLGYGQSCDHSGAGAGYYGGYCNVYSAGGGSGYTKSTLTNKAMYCYNCEESSDPNTYTVSTYGETTHENERSASCPNGYSDSAISKCAKAGNGYAKITYLGN